MERHRTNYAVPAQTIYLLINSIFNLSKAYHLKLKIVPTKAARQNLPFSNTTENCSAYRKQSGESYKLISRNQMVDTKPLFASSTKAFYQVNSTS